ncbi:hypothetical protein, partial [Leptospira adleri]
LALTSSIVFSIGITAVVTAVGAAAAVVAFAPYTAISMAVFAVTAAVTLGMVLFVTAGAVAVFALGSVVNWNTPQTYLAGGYSKSSWNNIHWDEKAARKWACYMSAGQLAIMIAAGAVYGVPGLGVPGYVYGPGGTATDSLSAFEIAKGLPIERIVFFGSIALTLKSAIQGDWENVGYGIVGFATDSPIGLAVNYVKGTVRTCEGDL